MGFFHRKNLVFTVRVVRHRLPREVGDALCLEVLKARLEKGLSNLV